MDFTPLHAKLVLHVLSNVDIKGGDIKLFEAITALHELAESADKRQVFIHMPSDRPIEALKMIRTLTGWGLKEAKDWLDYHNPARMTGTFGPLMIVEDGGDAVKKILEGGGIEGTMRHIGVLFEPNR